LLSPAAEHDELRAEDLEMLGEAAWAIGRYADSLRVRERAYAAYCAVGNHPAAAALAVMIATDYIVRLELAVATGWHQTARRILQGEAECPSHGMVAWLDAQAAMELGGDLDAALVDSQEAAAIGDRLGDPNVQMLGLATQGRVLIKQGKIDDGMAMTDEAMAIAISGQLSLWAAGYVYCNTLSVCQEIADFRRGIEWTEAARRCHANGSILPSSGHCRVHKAGVLRQHGDWKEAEEEARCGCDELLDMDRYHIGMAMEEIGEIRLRKGDLSGAEDALERAHELGRAAQPGLALLRLAHGKPDAALTSIGTALADDRCDRLTRHTLRAAQVEIAITAGKLEVARSAVEEMTDIAQAFGTAALGAALAAAEGAILLAAGNGSAALKELRRACQLWQEVDAPYEVARARVLLAEAYLAQLDHDSAALELRAARSTFERLGAVPEVRRVAELQGARQGQSPPV
jgi:tetratricopeptide (TPR) repeat protein